jgi:hypothetical protein
MSRTQSRVFAAMLILGALYFIMFWPVNALGAHDRNMLSVFEPDEFAQYSHPLRMLNQPGRTLNQSIYRFIAYQHYYYGYPFYFYSSIVALLPVKLVVGLDNTALNMLLLRQLVSVLPMIAAALLLVYMQTGFNSYIRSVGIFLFLLTVPAVFRNDMWWHPESLVFFFIVVTFYFLYKDNLSFGGYFYLSALACGLAIATKLIGLFFFLAIPAYLFIGWRQGRINLKNCIRLSVTFVALMTLTFALSNPFLFFAKEREAAFKIQTRQAEAMSSGFVLSYAKGPETWIPLITENYAAPLFLLISFIALGFGIANKEKRLLNILIAAWAIPFALYLLFAVAIKPKHFFIPILLPVFSALPCLFDWFFPLKREKPFKVVLFVVVAGVASGQLIYNFNYDQTLYLDELNKEKDSRALRFYDALQKNLFARIPPDDYIYIYRDVRVYIPDLPRWQATHRWGTVDYAFIQKNKFDVLVLWKQRLYDYTNEGAADLALDQADFAEAARFYHDALNHRLTDYTLVYEDDYGLAYISNALYDLYFK